MNVNYLTIAGLLCDIIGVCILFKFGLPSDLNKHGHIYHIFEQEDEGEKLKWKYYDRMSKFGLTLLILGFIFQSIPSIIALMKK